MTGFENSRRLVARPRGKLFPSRKAGHQIEGPQGPFCSVAFLFLLSSLICRRLVCSRPRRLEVAPREVAPPPATPAGSAAKHLAFPPLTSRASRCLGLTRGPSNRRRWLLRCGDGDELFQAHAVSSIGSVCCRTARTGLVSQLFTSRYNLSHLVSK